MLKNTVCRIRNVLLAAGPLGPAGLFYGCSLILFGTFRALLLLRNLDRLADVPHIGYIFPIGLRMDTVLLCYVLVLPCCLLLFLPAAAVRALRALLCAWFAVLSAVFIFMEIATFPFMAEFDTRPDRLFIEHLLREQEVISMVMKAYLIQAVAGIVAAAVTGFVVWRMHNSLLKRWRGCGLRRRVLATAVLLPLLVLGARSSLGHRPANVSTAAFSQSHLANQLGLNSTYSLLYAWYGLRRHEKDPTRVYGKMPAGEMMGRVRRYMHAAPARAGTQPPAPGHTPNLVIILEESLGAEYVGCLGGLPLTPNIDRLSRSGLLFTRLYSTGTRTVRGIEAVVSGFLPTPGTSVVKLGLAQQNFFTLAGLLRRRGYDTEFVYGGNSKFDNMRAFFLGNGFQHVYDRASFDKPGFAGTWGVCDEDLFQQANRVFAAHGQTPFFALLLTTSNHDPFEFPPDRIQLYEQPAATRHNAIKYADYALGRFFALAGREDYYKNTVFLIVADHSTRLRGQDLIPVKKFHIPGIMIGPGIVPGTWDRVASQIDMPSTLLYLMGISAQTPLVGRPLPALPAATPGRAVMQYGDTHAFMVGDRIVIHRPGMEPVQAVYRDDKLLPDKLDAELVRDALAHALLPGYLYQKRLYSLPPAHP